MTGYRWRNVTNTELGVVWRKWELRTDRFDMRGSDPVIIRPKKSVRCWLGHHGRRVTQSWHRVGIGVHNQETGGFRPWCVRCGRPLS